MRKSLEKKVSDSEKEKNWQQYQNWTVILVPDTETEFRGFGMI